MTVKELYKELQHLVENGQGDKVVAVETAAEWLIYLDFHYTEDYFIIDA